MSAVTPIIERMDSQHSGAPESEAGRLTSVVVGLTERESDKLQDSIKYAVEQLRVARDSRDPSGEVPAPDKDPHVAAEEEKR